MTRHAWRQYSICRDIYISRHSHALDKNDTYILPGFHVNDQLTTTGPIIFMITFPSPELRSRRVMEGYPGNYIVVIIPS